MKAFGWSLADIDNTNVESLMAFIARVSGQRTKKWYCDEVNFL